jgi:predicted nucleic acid-binding protein
VTRAFFYDTWALVALADRRDPAHPIAVRLDEELERRRYSAVTTDYVLDEAVTVIHATVGAKGSLPFLELIHARTLGQELLLVQVGETRRGRASELFRKLAREERRLSFTDATSFAVMLELRIELAFTADRHFHRAGSGIRPLVEQKRGRYVATAL